MDAYDNNNDGRIDIRELAQLLPLEEGFKLLFKFENQVDSSVEFMKIWTKYDTDASGYIDANELRDFLRDLIVTNQANGSASGGAGLAGSRSAKKGASVDEDKLDEYTETLLKIFDSNKDGKLQLNEMTK
jgi:Ca2+-binding EF-hand superfamily protein